MSQHTDSVWSQYTPSDMNAWDLKKVAHLHRRAGLGANWIALQRDLKDGPEAAVSRLLYSDAESDELHQNMEGLQTGIVVGPDRSERLQSYWVHRLLFDPQRLRERMTLFWHNHFATSNEKVRNEAAMLQQNEVLRMHALGDFGKLLEEMLVNPAMLIWLDGANSPKQRPNENLARELLELFTLGVGNYSESDIREVSRALTGWISDPEMYGGLNFRFDPAQFDDGTKTIFGRTGNFRRQDVVQTVLDQPACAGFICAKLYRQLVCEDQEPPVELIEPLAQELRSSGYSVHHVIGIILRSRHFYSEAAHRRRIASPVELNISFLRTLDFPRTDIRLLPIAEACQRQGQYLFYPPNVAGWAGSRNWMTSTSILERTNILSDLIWGNPECDFPAFDVEAWSERNGVPMKDAGLVLTDLLVQGELSSKARSMVMETARTSRPDDVRKAIQLLVHCPEYQLF